MNNVILIGYLGGDAESRPTRNESTVTNLSLATQRVWKDRDTGERRTETSWHRLVCFGRLAEYASSLTKGAHLQITGEIHTREYTAKDGAKKSVTEIRVNRITRLDRPATSNPNPEVAA